MSLAVISQADILVSLSRLQLLYSPARTVWETENGVVVANPVYVDVDVDLAVAARDKSAGSLALLVSDVPTHWVRTCLMSFIGRVDCDDVDDTRVYCHRRTSPLSLGSTPSFRFGLKIAILGGFRGILGAFWGLVWPPWIIFLPKMDRTIVVGIENYYTGPT